ncbi:polyribonucleotide nucleotidyltransferase [candidate division TA06 bacterium]|uniref:Polyribonucleotide nucleotidyltransferase n=1 Tax=candidate division TA06 bacterium TaxID=2250710 RepID=A0A523XWC2_UNCT6|nr:MAG: polyribonucleotide nucleotidyltransferase [candidate division TA06 bacterium]
MIHKVETDLGGRPLIIECGKMAKQADGAVTVRYGDTIVLITVCASEEPREGIDYLPLMVDYREKTYAAGKIPGGFFKREGRPTEKEILSARLIDRPIRPLFQKGVIDDIQIVATVLSSDRENDSDILGSIGASSALAVSDVPFDGPIGIVRVGMVDGSFVINPTFPELENASLNLVVAGNGQRITTIEVHGQAVKEKEIVNALELALGEIGKLVELQKELRSLYGRPKRELHKIEVSPELRETVVDLAVGRVVIANSLQDIDERFVAIEKIKKELVEQLSEKYPDSEAKIGFVLEELISRDMRRRVIEEGKRLDNRQMDGLRSISCEVGILPRAHGSALFTRGQTQSLCAATLGTTVDEQKIENLAGESFKSFMLHYNFPPFSVGEVIPIRGPRRREVGHGALAEKALQSVIPSEDIFPYTIRIVSDILESNGSSSMAAVCGGSLCLMDAGVPIKSAVAGVAMGLVVEGEKQVILTDIAGAEDHYGDMDFKVAGTAEGITAIQLDTKVEGITLDTVEKALEQARENRLQILEVMSKTIEKPRGSISSYAPVVLRMEIPKSKIGEVIGPGGRVIRSLIEETGAEIEIKDDGKVTVVSHGEGSAELAMKKIEAIVEEVEVGKTYVGKVTRIMNFGAFVEILPGKEGLVHISQLAPHRVGKVTDEVSEGEEVTVKVVGVDEQGRINLSRKVLMAGGDQERHRPRDQNTRRYGKKR